MVDNATGFTTPVKQSRYAHVWYDGNKSIFWNSLTLELLEGDESDYQVWLSYAIPRTADNTRPVQELLKARFLVPVEEDTPGQSVDRLRRLREKALKNRDGRIGFMRISLTERCNMNCSYCFQQRLFKSGQPDMSVNRFEEIMNWFIAHNEGRSPAIQYFGGEPLLRFDLIELGNDMLRSAKQRGQLKNFTQVLTTNGTLLTDEVSKFLVANGFDVTFSLDGWQEINDRFRLFKNGRGTYEATLAGIARFRQAGGRVSILITPRPDNIALLPKIVRHFVEDLKATSIGINSPQPTSSGWEVDGACLASAVQEIWAYCVQQGVLFHALGTQIPRHLRKRLPQVDRCIDANPHGNEADWPIYVTADGQMSFCMVHHRDRRCTRPITGDVIDHAFRQWHLNPNTQPECDECIAGQICGGPCSLELLLRDGALNPDRCKFYRCIVEGIVTRW